jgi:4-hydroxy-3-methylbut-2-enyl diphosphate reductase IspH
MGFGYWSLSRFLKYRVKKAVDFVFKFEENLANYCKKRGFDGVICGHIHHAEIKEINGVMYMNDGDWVESCTALVEHHNGRWEIITWTKEHDDVDIDNTGSTSKQSKRHSGTSIDRISYPPGLRASSVDHDQLAKI